MLLLLKKALGIGNCVMLFRSRSRACLTIGVKLACIPLPGKCGVAYPVSLGPVGFTPDFPSRGRASPTTYLEARRSLGQLTQQLFLYTCIYLYCVRYIHREVLVYAVDYVRRIRELRRLGVSIVTSGNLTVLGYCWYNSPLSDHTSLLNSAIL